MMNVERVAGYSRLDECLEDRVGIDVVKVRVNRYLSIVSQIHMLLACSFNLTGETAFLFTALRHWNFDRDHAGYI